MGSFIILPSLSLTQFHIFYLITTIVSMSFGGTAGAAPHKLGSRADLP